MHLLLPYDPIHGKTFIPYFAVDIFLRAFCELSYR